MLIIVPVAFTSAAAQSLRRDVLGLRLDISQQAVHSRLKKIGNLEREERGRQEVWTLKNDKRFSSLLVGYDKEYKVRYVTAIARGGGQRMRYTEIAPLKSARAENTSVSYSYTWEVKPGKNRRGYYLIAMGRDPQFLTSISIKRHNREP